MKFFKLSPTAVLAVASLFYVVVLGIRAHISISVNKRLDSAKYSFQAGCFDFASALCRRLSTEAQTLQCFSSAERGCPIRAEKFQDFLKGARK